MNVYLPDALNSPVHTSLDTWQKDKNVQRLWAKDSSLWTGTDENEWLGWLDILSEQVTSIETLEHTGNTIAKDNFQHILLLGTGGSSLCPEVFTRTFPTKINSPTLHILDSTDPSQITAVESSLDLVKTKIIVSSKSGATLEPNILRQYFFDQIKNIVKPKTIGEHFIALTDPQSNIELLAKQNEFSAIFHGVPSIGGRYSALSNFGMLPASTMGIDIRKLLTRAKCMGDQCRSSYSLKHNPGVMLGTIIGICSNHGRNKLTIVTTPTLTAFGSWIEQLLAESTGKEGKGVIPIDREICGPPEVYNGDRLFIHLILEGEQNSEQDTAINKLRTAKHPVISITLTDLYDLGGEIFRWELAAAVAAAILGVNPFNQPNVEESKALTLALTKKYEETGNLPSEPPLLKEHGVSIFMDKENAKTLTSTIKNESNLLGYLKGHLNTIQNGDYFAILAYIQMKDEYHEILDTIRHIIRDTKKVATCLEYGPRYLHSTGQLHKGGPNSGVFIQITCDNTHDIKIPNCPYTFGLVKDAQAQGDFQVLSKYKRRILRFHLGPNITSGLELLKQKVLESVY